MSLPYEPLSGRAVYCQVREQARRRRTVSQDQNQIALRVTPTPVAGAAGPADETTARESLERIENVDKQLVNNTTQYDVSFKLIIVGESAVGKTHLLHSYMDRAPTSSTSGGACPPVGMSDSSMAAARIAVTCPLDLRSILLRSGGQRVQLRFWDTAGSEKFRSLVPRYFNDAHGVFLVFDLTRHSTFRELPYWLEKTKNHAANQAVYALLGNKSDLEDRREVNYTEAANWAREHRLTYIETSALESRNVNKAIDDVALALINKRELVEELQRDMKKKCSSRLQVGISSTPEKASHCPC